MISKCPQCGGSEISKRSDHVFGAKESQGDRAFYRCSSCSVIFQVPQLSPEEEEHFYKKEFESFMASRASQEHIDWNSLEAHRKTNDKQRERRENYLLPLYRKLSQKRAGKLLEFGCSSGFMFSGLKQRFGFDCYGVEPSDVFCSSLKKEGYKVEQSLEAFQKSYGPIRFDIISHFFVLEHIRDPMEFLTNQFELLEPGGVIVGEIPCYSDPLLDLYKVEAFEKFYWSIAHPWYFDRASLSYLLGKKCKFQDFSILLDQRYDLGNHLHWVRNGKPGGQSSLDNIFDAEFMRSYSSALIRAGMADTLVFLIRKI